MDQLLITIAMTCFNAEDTIASALDSAIAQDWPNKDIVVVDDASTDGSRAVLARYAAKHGVRVIRHDRNMGIGAARNTLAAAARGEFVAFFDDDDVSERDRLSKQIGLLQAREADTRRDYICFAARLMAPSGAVLPGSGFAGDVSGAEVVDIVRETRHGRALGKHGACTMFARRSVLKGLGFDPAFRRAEDTDFIVRFLLGGGHLTAVSKPLILKRVTRTSDKSDAEHRKHRVALLRKHRRLMSIGAFAAEVARENGRYLLRRKRPLRAAPWRVAARLLSLFARR